MAEVFVLVPAMTPGKALEIADDFLDGLIDHAAFLGYYDPDAGEASTVFALAAVRSARSALAVLPTEETTGAGLAEQLAEVVQRTVVDLHRQRAITALSQLLEAFEDCTGEYAQSIAADDLAYARESLRIFERARERDQTAGPSYSELVEALRALVAGGLACTKEPPNGYMCGWASDGAPDRAEKLCPACRARSLLTRIQGETADGD